MNDDKLLEVHVWTDVMPFSVMIYVQDREQEKTVRHMEACHKKNPLSTESMCAYCILHGIQYRILQPIHKTTETMAVYHMIEERLNRLGRAIRRK